MKSTDSPGAVVDPQAEADYRQMIQAVARAMAGNQVDAVLPYLNPRFEAKHVEMFVDGNFEKRIDLLLRMMPFVSEDEDFEEFEELAIDFASEVPVGAYEGTSQECDAMLAWLEQEIDLSPEQRDTIRCQRMRFQIEQLARERHDAHIRFQELVSVAGELARQLQMQPVSSEEPEASRSEEIESPQLTLHLNPVHSWSSLQTAKYLGAGVQPPVGVLYYADGEEVRTAQFQPTGQIWIERLADCAPCSLEMWQDECQPLDAEEFQAFWTSLVALRLLALS